MHTAKSNFSNFVIEYPGKIETVFENILACLSGAYMGSNHEKSGGRKSRDTLPLKVPGDLVIHFQKLVNVFMLMSVILFVLAFSKIKYKKTRQT